MFIWQRRIKKIINSQTPKARNKQYFTNLKFAKFVIVSVNYVRNGFIKSTPAPQPPGLRGAGLERRGPRQQPRPRLALHLAPAADLLDRCPKTRLNKIMEAIIFLKLTQFQCILRCDISTAMNY
jgi:hypothetical protein